MACPLGLDLVAYAKGELSPSEQEAVCAHLPSCVDCQEELDAVEEVLGRVAALPSVAASADFAARVTKALSGDPEYARIARETRRREKEATVRRIGWWGWAGQSLRERVSSMPGWVAAAAVYLVAFGVLAWLLVPGGPHETVAGRGGGDRPTSEGPKGDEADHGAKTEPPGAASEGAPDPLAPDGRLVIVAMRTEAASRTRVAPEAARAIERGLAWIVSQQEKDGSWGSGSVAVTSLATLALLGDGHRSSGPMEAALGGGAHREAVSRAMAWLRGKQRADGAFDENARTHAEATIAAIEDLAFGEADKADTAAARRAVELAIARCRSSQLEDGSWERAEATAANVQALRLAQAIDVKGCAIPLERVRAWLSRPNTEVEAGSPQHSPFAREIARTWVGIEDLEDPASLKNLWEALQAFFVAPATTSGRLSLVEAARQTEPEATELAGEVARWAMTDQAAAGSWPAPPPPVGVNPAIPPNDAVVETALRLLILEAPYRVPRLPRAK